MNELVEAEELNLMTLAQEYSDEKKARKLWEEMRWPDGPVCPHCGNHKDKKIYKLEGKKGSRKAVRDGVYKCGACRKQFTAMVKSIVSDSHLPLSKWLMAMFIICASKKSVSAHQLHRMLGITYKSAWFMAHRIRYALGTENGPGGKLDGMVEADETFVGGKSTMRQRYNHQTPVVALVERGGKMRARVVSNVTQKNLGKVLNECVARTATMMTDEHGAYRNPLKDWKEHHTVVHSRGEYSRELPDGRKVGINTCESFFSLLKRGVHGSWHHVSKEHRPKYAGEFEFRWNTRKLTDGERLKEAIKQVEGKRLTYKQTV